MAFLAVAVFGVILKASKSLVQQILEAVLKNEDIDNDQLEELATFVTENAGR